MHLDFRIVATNGIHLHMAQSGPVHGRQLILLHGFPEFWYGWRRQIPFLAQQGFRVWAPDQRGYNLSDKPQSVRDYALDELAKDIIGLADAAGEKRTLLVGHDWGAAVAWWVAMRYPDRLDRLVIINVPHPAVMARQLRRSIRQLGRSWYMFFFQLPWLPERLARAGNWRMMVQAMRSSSLLGTFTEEDWDRYRAAWAQPGALSGMLNWYRAALRAPGELPSNPRVSVPTLLIWGAQDRFLGSEMAAASEQLCDQGRLVLIEEATHWVQHEFPDRVNQLIVEHVA